MRRFLSILSGVLLLSAALTAPASAFIDTRICSGNPGVRVYEDANRTGSGVLLCFTKYGPWVSYSNISNISTNLNFGANWNDRITSYITFNNSGHTMRFYSDANFTADSTGGRIVTTSGDDNVDNLGLLYANSLRGGYNDRITSILFIP